MGGKRKEVVDGNYVELNKHSDHRDFPLHSAWPGFNTKTPNKKRRKEMEGRRKEKRGRR